MGAYDPCAQAQGEAPLKYHPRAIRFLTGVRETGAGTVLGGQFDWGGLLPKGNGGVQRSTQRGWQSRAERKGISGLDCERDISSRHESGA